MRYVEGAGVAVLSLGVYLLRKGMMGGFGRDAKNAEEPHWPLVVAGVVGGLAGFWLVGMEAVSGILQEDVSSPTRFSAARSPALSLSAPPGWLLSDDRDTGRLVAAGPGASLMVETSRVTDRIDPAEFLSKQWDLASHEGGTDEGTFEEELNGRFASARSFRFENAGSAVWYVNRGRMIVTTIHCKVEGSTSARDACRPVLSALTWRGPDIP